MDTVTAKEARDRIGDLAQHVADTGATVHLTADGAPAGALAPLARVTELGLTLAGTASITQARAEWAPLRSRAETHGPQALIRHSTVAAVLLGPTHAHALSHGLPLLPTRELHWDGATMRDEHGEPIPPGDYLIPEGGTLHVAANNENE